MVKFRHFLAAIFICLTLATICALAQSSLTQIRDTITNSDGTPFNGMVVITWNGYSVPSGTPVSQLSASARIYNGALSVLLVPTTTATAGTYYQILYSSSDGSVTWAETWQVPPSTTPLTLRQVRQSTTQGPGGTTLATQGQYATLPIAINQVTNLSASLSNLNNSIATLNTQVAGLPSSTTVAAIQTTVTGLATSLTNLTGTVNSLTTTVNGLAAGAAAPVFVDAQAPAGTINGTNTQFNLTNTPSPATSLGLYRNGLLQASGIDYTLAGAGVTFLTASTPKQGDILQAFYRVAGTGTSSTIVDAEVPAGAVNGTNMAFTLANIANPSASLKLYKNGLLLSQNADYSINGANIVFATQAVAPQTGDSILASYRH